MTTCKGGMGEIPNKSANSGRHTLPAVLTVETQGVSWRSCLYYGSALMAAGMRQLCVQLRKPHPLHEPKLTRKETSRPNGQREEKINHCMEVKLELATARMVQDTSLKQVQKPELQISAYVMTSCHKTLIGNRLKVSF